jgi:hypothetical protein
MIDRASSNATATFYVLEETEVEDPYGDPVKRSEWAALDREYPVRFEAQGSEFVLEASGDRVHQSERLFAPLSLATRISEGAPVIVDHLGQEETWRISGIRRRSIDGHEGFCELQLSEFDDEESSDPDRW